MPEKVQMEVRTMAQARSRVKNYFRRSKGTFLLGPLPGALAVYSYLCCCENRNNNSGLVSG